FALVPGLVILVARKPHPWTAFVWIFIGSFLWLVRCGIDLGLRRRPLLEPNLNMAGLTCMAIGVLGLLMAETVSLKIEEGTARNPEGPAQRDAPLPTGADEHPPLDIVLKKAPLPSPLRPNPPQVILKRVLACVAQLGLVAALIVVG